MQQWVRDQNIKLFSAKLAGDLSPSQRLMIEALLSQELAGVDDEPPRACTAKVARMGSAKARL